MIPSKSFARISVIGIVLVMARLSALADFIMLDPDGGGNAAKVTINTFQYGAGNSLAMGE